MKPHLFCSIVVVMCLGYMAILAADINITNITPANAIPAGSYALGTTGSVTRLLPIDLIRAGLTFGTVTASPPTNSILRWLPVTIGGTNYYLPLCNTNGT